MSKNILFLLFFASLFLNGCGIQRSVIERDDSITQTPSPSRSGGYYQDDGPGDNPPDLSNISDAIPKQEPLLRAANKPYSVFGKQYVPDTTLKPYKANGVASWYGRKFHGQRTSSGEIYDMYAMTAAHTTLPIPSYARVTNLNNGKSIIVRINDRGPFHAGRIIDLSFAAAYKLGFIGAGSAQVQVESIAPEKLEEASFREKNPSPLNLPNRPTIVASENSLETSGELPAIFIQLGAFSMRNNAEIFYEKIRQQLNEIKEAIHLVQKDGLFRVQIGPYRDSLEAIGIAEKIREALDLKTTIVER